MGFDVSNATEIDVEKFPMLEALRCFEEGRVGTPKTVNLARVRLPLGEAVSAFASNIHVMGEKLQPFMDFALGAKANVTDRFRFRDTGLQVAGSQRDSSPINCCVTGYRGITRLVEGLTLPCVPGVGGHTAPTPLSVAPGPSHPQPKGGGSSGKFGK